MLGIIRIYLVGGPHLRAISFEGADVVVTSLWVAVVSAVHALGMGPHAYGFGVL